MRLYICSNYIPLFIDAKGTAFRIGAIGISLFPISSYAITICVHYESVVFQDGSIWLIDKDMRMFTVLLSDWRVI